MKKNNVYESPEFKFQEMRLLENIADTCFGNGKLYLDVDNDGKLSNVDVNIPLGGGCQGSAAAKQLNQWMNANGHPGREYGPNVCNTKENGFISQVS